MFTVITDKAVFRVAPKALSRFKAEHTVLGVHKDGQKYSNLW